MVWTDILDISAAARAALGALPRQDVPRGTVLFRPGDAAQGFVVVLAGRVEVFLTGASGREILLYAVEPGQSCVQTTLGLMAEEAYSGEAHAATEAVVAMIPKAMFARLMQEEPGFRAYVMQAFARRMADVTRLLEQVAFGRVEARLAQALLEMAVEDRIAATHSELAARIGSAREVVSRRLEAFQRQGWVQTERGEVRLTDIVALRRLVAAPL